MQSPSFMQLPLVPLGEEAVRELLADLLGEHASVSGLAAVVHQRAGGNPFFVEEIVQTLVETGGTPRRQGSLPSRTAGRRAHAAGDRAGGSGGAHRPAAGTREAAPAASLSHRQDVLRARAHAYMRSQRRRPSGGHSRAQRRGVSLRAVALSARRVCVQASLDPRGCRSLTAQGAPWRNPCCGCARNRRAVGGPARRGGGSGCASLGGGGRGSRGGALARARGTVDRSQQLHRSVRPLAAGGHADRRHGTLE